MTNLKNVFLILFGLASCGAVSAQNVGIGTNSPNAKAALEISSSDKGLLMPRLGSAQRTAINNPPKGLMVYDTTYSTFYYYDGGRWLPFYEQNYDSATIDYMSTAVLSFNLSTVRNNNFNISRTLNSGFIYDNGGPAGNYLANSSSSGTITKDDSTLLIRIDVEEMAAEVFYDSLFLISGADINDLDTIGISGTQTGSYTFNSNVTVLFKSNGINNLSGFKIRWGRIKANNSLQEPAPLYGWHFNTAKQAAMGGVQKDKNWSTDSVGYFSFSYGNGAKAKGNFSIATGQYALATTTNSIAIGSLSNATGISSAAFGSSSEASGDFSTAIGNSNVASGSRSTALGYNVTAIGVGATAIGTFTNATGNHSTTMGEYTNAVGSYSTAIGLYTTATGQSSTAIGLLTTAAGQASTAMGQSTSARGTISTAMGGGTTASGTYSTAMGWANTARAYASLAIGRYNDSIATSSPTVWVETDPLFIIGNGTSGATSNAMVVLKNGNVAIGNNSSPETPLHITVPVTNVTLAAGSGSFTLGATNSLNMVMDQNDIQVRQNGAASNLSLQRLGGNIGIGNTGIPAYQLEITGTAGKPGGGTWSNASDKRLKENVTPYTDGLAALLKIKPVWYNYNFQSGFDTKKKYVGVLAQDLQAVSPYMVSASAGTKAPDGSNYLQVDNSAMTYMLINAVKEQQKEIEQLKELVRDLLKK